MGENKLQVKPATQATKDVAAEDQARSEGRKAPENKLQVKPATQATKDEAAEDEATSEGWKAPENKLQVRLATQVKCGGSMFCFTYVRSKGRGPDLLALQHKQGASIFACDAQSIYSDEPAHVATLGVKASHVKIEINRTISV